MRLEAPIMLTGLAALSVETQKYFLTPISMDMLDGFIRVEHIDVNHTHQREGVFFAAYMLERRKIELVVIDAVGFDKSVIFNRANIQGESLEITIDITKRAANIPHQLDHVILADINNMQFAWISFENFLCYCLANRTCTTEY